MTNVYSTKQTILPEEVALNFFSEKKALTVTD